MNRTKSQQKKLKVTEQTSKDWCEGHWWTS